MTRIRRRQRSRSGRILIRATGGVGVGTGDPNGATLRVQGNSTLGDIAICGASNWGVALRDNDVDGLMCGLVTGCSIGNTGDARGCPGLAFLPVCL